MISRIKRIEIRDRATCVLALAYQVSRAPEPTAPLTRVNTEPDRFMWRAGFGDEPMVVVTHLATMRTQYDPFAWDNRTMHTAHAWLSEHFDEVEDRGVVDVEFILGETTTPKTSEIGA